MTLAQAPESARVDAAYPRGPRQYGSDIISDLLLEYDIPYVALNPGASYRGLHDSIVQRGGNKPEMILCQHEEIAVQIAHGYAKATGKPMAAILHDVVGLLHACMAIYYAYLDRAPILILGATGPMNEAKRRPHIDWIHTANVQGNAVRDYTKWDDQPTAPEGIPGSFARGYRVATSEPQGPVYLCYDAALQEDRLTSDVDLPPAHVARTPSRMAADPKALAQVADLLARAERPVLIAEYLARDPSAFDALVRLAETSGAAVVDIGSRLNFPSNHPLDMTDTDILREADLVVMLDVRDAEREISVLESATRKVTRIVPPECKFVEVGFADLELSSWSMDYGRLQDMQLSVLGDTSLAVPALADLVAERIDKSRVEQRIARIAPRRTEARARWQAEARENWDAVPMTTGRLALEVWEAIKNEDWVLTAGGLKDWAHKLWDFDKAYRHAGRELGTATQIGISLGVALGHKGTGRLVVDLQPDGDLMFDLGALWIAAKYEIPILVVMYNNRAYYNDWEHQLRMARVRGTDPDRAYIGMDISGPAPDFAAIARAQGWHAEGPIEHGDQVAAALKRAIEVVKSGRPALVDTVTQFR